MKDIYFDKKTKYSKTRTIIHNKRFIKTELKGTDYLLNNINGYSLDREQRIAVITDECANLVVAGAGSGKSLTMIGKIRYLIERKNIKEEEILCISFTNDASNNLEKNIKKNYGYNIKVYTFHKLSLEILKEKHYKISPSNLLEYIVDEYFNSIIYNNKEMVLRVKKVLNKIDYPYKYILKLKDFLLFKKLIITFINLFKTNGYSINYFLRIKKDKDIISIIIDIYYLYESELRSNGLIDFNDMIIKATDYIKENKIKDYKYIIVDEYQDTSYIRYLLLKEIINQTKAKIICVGDDYQSIYRFTGCNLDVFLNFKKYFGYSKVLKINQTYRNSQELISVAGLFIMKNKNQLYKKLRSNKRLNKPIKIIYDDDIKRVLDMICLKYNNVLILGRNNFDINKYTNTINNYNKLNIRYLTMHASKGLEEECVIIINLSNNILGMPNKIKNNHILKYVTINNNNYPYDEERRLFYVALTRTKNEVYLMVDRNNPSIFVKELIEDYSSYIEYI